jgi:tRNA A-37 threonylcarbamoyl transferase component Bud32
MSNFAFTGEIMEEELKEPEDEDEYEKLNDRNELIENVLSTLPRQINVPFPYIDLNHHWKLKRPNAVKGTIMPIIEPHQIIDTIKWFGEHIWGNVITPFIHGDITYDNVVNNPPYLFIIDFDPENIQSLDLTGNPKNDNLKKIAGDLIDFFKSVETLNQKHNPEYNINSLGLGLDFHTIIQIWNNHDLEIPPEFIEPLKDFLRHLIEPGMYVRLFPTNGGKRKSKRKSKRKIKL